MFFAKKIPIDEIRGVSAYTLELILGFGARESEKLKYMFGLDNARNYDAARIVAENMQNNSVALNYIGVLYDNGMSVPVNYSKALDYYAAAAKKGNATAMYNLGVMYYSGRGTAPNKALAIEWYQSSAEQGNVLAQYNLAYMLDKGEGGSVNKKEAFKWYYKAAAGGDADAQCNLGVMYEKGDGVKLSYADAVIWYKKSAKQGEATAQYNLGIMYETGTGTRQNIAEAMRWFAISAAQGKTKAAKRHENLSHYTQALSVKNRVIHCSYEKNKLLSAREKENVAAYDRAAADTLILKKKIKFADAVPCAQEQTKVDSAQEQTNSSEENKTLVSAAFAQASSAIKKVKNIVFTKNQAAQYIFGSIKSVSSSDRQLVNKSKELTDKSKISFDKQENFYNSGYDDFCVASKEEPYNNAQVVYHFE